MIALLGLGFLGGLAGLALGLIGLLRRARVPGLVGVLLALSGAAAEGVIHVPVHVGARRVVSRGRLKARLAGVGRAIYDYRMSHEKHAFPKDLQTLVEGGWLEARELRATDGGTDAFFYCPPSHPSHAGDVEAVLACDRASSGGGRHVLYAGGHVAWRTEAEFRDELSKPLNARFAREFAKAPHEAGGHGGR